MNQREAIFAAALDQAVLDEEPHYHEDDQGYRWWECRALLGAWASKQPKQVYILPLCPGWALPYRKGDVVRVVHAQETAIVVGIYAPAIDHEGHTVIGPRPDTNKDLRLGPVEGGEWEPVALYERAAEEIRGLKAQINAIVTVLQAVPGGSTIEGMIEGLDTTLGEVTGGDPASRVMGRKA